MDAIWIFMDTNQEKKIKYGKSYQYLYLIRCIIFTLFGKFCIQSWIQSYPFASIGRWV